MIQYFRMLFRQFGSERLTPSLDQADGERAFFFDFLRKITNMKLQPAQEFVLVKRRQGVPVFQFFFQTFFRQSFQIAMPWICFRTNSTLCSISRTVSEPKAQLNSSREFSSSSDRELSSRSRSAVAFSSGMSRGNGSFSPRSCRAARIVR